MSNTSSFLPSLGGFRPSTLYVSILFLSFAWFSSRSRQSTSSFTPTSKSSTTSGAASAALATVAIDCSVLPIIMTTLGSLTEDRSTSSSAGFGPDLTFKSFWRLGSTFVSASMHRFRHATSASSGTETENCFPCHLTATVVLPSSAISPGIARPRVISNRRMQNVASARPKARRSSRGFSQCGPPWGKGNRRMRT